jgi:large subunit ribosomal protein L18
MRRYKNKTIERKTKIRAKLRRLTDRLRLSVFRSHQYIYAQIIDDEQGKTLVSVNEKELSKKSKSKIERALALGQLLAQKAKKKKIKQVYLDRGQYQYHGRVKALAEGARKGGLEF